MNAMMKRMRWHRWTGYAVMLASYFLVNFHKMSLGAVQDILTESFGLTAGQYSALNSVYFYAYAAMQIPTGILVDTLGARKTSFYGCLFMGIGAVLYGLANSYAILLISRAAVGLGASVMFLSILKYQAEWFNEREFGKITGFTSFVANIGGTIAQAPLALLVFWLSWKLTFISIGLLTLLLGLGIILLVADCVNSKTDNPSPAFPDGRKFAIVEGIKSVLSCKYIYPIMIINFIANGIFATMAAWAVPYLTNCFGLSSAAAGNITMFVPVVAAVTALLCGNISDRICNRKIINIIMSALLALSLYALYYSQNKGHSLSVASAMIIISGSTMFYAINYGLIKDVCPVCYSGIATSVLNVATFIGGSVLPSAFSRVLANKAGDVQNSYHAAFGLLIICSIAMVAASFFLLETNCQNHYNELRNGQYKKSVLSFK